MLARLVALAIGFTPFLFPPVSFAHAFGQSYTLPIPIWIFLYGGTAAVALSFILIGFFVGQTSQAFKVKSWPARSRLLRALTGPTATAIFRAIGAGLFILTIAAGLLGNPDGSSNIAPTLFWIIFLLGTTYLSALLGDIWSVLNPWQTLVELWELLAAEKLTGIIKYPTWLSYWPAVVSYYLLIWNELLSGGQSALPHNLAQLLLIYTTITFSGVFLFGKKVWFERAEIFSVFFGLVSKISIFEKKAGRLYLRPPFVGLLKEKLVSFPLLIFILFMLSSTAFDGFRGTSAWFKLDLAIFPLYDSLGTNGYQVFQTIALALAPVIFLTVYLLLIAVMKYLVRSKLSIKDLALTFGLSLIPIAVVYNVAHYFNLLLTQGQAVISLISDPFGMGWDIFGTAGFMPNIGLIRADTTWYLQVFFIVLGHIAAVYLAHILALRLFPKHRTAIISQLPMLALMVIYTLTGLWILSQPLSPGF